MLSYFWQSIVDRFCHQLVHAAAREQAACASSNPTFKLNRRRSPSDCVSLSAGCGPTVRRAPTAARDPKLPFGSLKVARCEGLRSGKSCRFKAPKYIVCHRYSWAAIAD